MKVWSCHMVETASKGVRQFQAQDCIHHVCGNDILFEDTVDGSDILRSPVEVGRLSPYLQGSAIIPGVIVQISEPSTVATVVVSFCSIF